MGEQEKAKKKEATEDNKEAKEAEKETESWPKIRRKPR